MDYDREFFEADRYNEGEEERDNENNDAENCEYDKIDEN